MAKTAHRAIDSKVEASVSEATRMDSKLAELQWGKLQNEKSKLKEEKRKLEARFSEIEQWKREQLAKIYRGPIGLQHAKTNEIECSYQEKRRSLTRELSAIEERLRQIAARLGNKKTDLSQEIAERERAKVESLRRIEALLKRVLIVLGDSSS